MSTPPAKPPEILDKIVDIVLGYRPKSKLKSAKQRKKSTKKVSHSQKPSVPMVQKERDN